MTLVRRFLMVEIVWAVGILVPMVAIALLGSEPLSTAQVLRWTGRALGLAAFPAGIAIAPAVVADARPWRQLILGLAAASVVAVALFVLIGVGHGEIQNRVIEPAGVAEISADRRCISRLGMGSGERPSTPFAIIRQCTRIENFNEWFNLDIA